MEEVIIGIILENNEVLDEIGNLSPYHFIKYTKLANTILQKYDKYGEVKDTDLILEGYEIPDYEKLTASKVIIHEKITELIDRYQKKELSKLLNRNLINVDVDEYIQMIRSNLDRIEGEYEKAKIEIHLGKQIDKLFAEIEQVRKGEKKIGLELKTLPSINRAIGGIIPGDLIGIYGIEKSTKTTLALEMAIDIAEQGNPTAIFSLEMTVNDLAWKTISMRTGIDVNELRNPNYSRLSYNEFEAYKRKAKSRLEKSEIYLIDDCYTEIEIYRRLKKLIKQNNVKFCVIDYLLLVETTKQNQLRERLNNLTRYFKLLAKKVHVPICVISQANEAGTRAAEAKGLERDSNYFFYVKKCEKGEKIKQIIGNVEFEYRTRDGDILIICRGIRHAKDGKGVIVRFVNNIYTEIDITKDDELI